MHLMIAWTTYCIFYYCQYVAPKPHWFISCYCKCVSENGIQTAYQCKCKYVAYQFNCIHVAWCNCIHVASWCDCIHVACRCKCRMLHLSVVANIPPLNFCKPVTIYLLQTLCILLYCKFVYLSVTANMLHPIFLHVCCTTFDENMLHLYVTAKSKERPGRIEGFFSMELYLWWKHVIIMTL